MERLCNDTSFCLTWKHACQMADIVYPPPPLSAWGGGVEPPTKFSKMGGGLDRSQFLEGGCWERGGVAVIKNCHNKEFKLGNFN